MRVESMKTRISNLRKVACIVPQSNEWSHKHSVVPDRFSTTSEAGTLPIVSPDLNSRTAPQEVPVQEFLES